MSITEYYSILDNFLITKGLTKIENKIFGNIYTLSIKWYDIPYKELSICTAVGNQYVYIKEVDENVPHEESQMVCIYNSDLQGNLTIEYLELLLQVINYKINN